MSPEQIAALAAKAAPLPGAAIPDPDGNRELHIDGDYAAYYFSGNDETTISQAKRNMLDAFQIVKDYGGVGGRVVVHLSAASSDKGKRWQIGTVKPYQGQRDSGRKPKNWQGMRDFLEAGMPGSNVRAKLWYDREADDGAAASARFAHEQGKLPVIFSRDKDFRMIPGLHVVWTTYETVLLKPGTFELIGPDEKVYGDKWFWLQMIQGDTADNIPGLERIKGKTGFKTCGEACAKEVLKSIHNNGDAYFNVSLVYEDYYGEEWADRFVEQAALLWMRSDNKADVADFLKVIPQPEAAIHRAIIKLKERIK